MCSVIFGELMLNAPEDLFSMKGMIRQRRGKKAKVKAAKMHL